MASTDGRRTNFNFPQYSAETQAYLVDFNTNVPLYYWAGLICIIGTVTVANWALKLQGYFRRRKSGRRVTTKKLPRVKSRTIEPETQEETTVHHASVRYFWYWLSAFWRKYSIKHSNIAEFFFLGDLGQLFLLMIYLLLNFLLIFLGTENDIDWMAHHAAKLTYANMPLVIGLAGKNNVLSKLTGFAYESLNVLHRWSARFVIISSAIHIGGRIHVNVPSVHPDATGQRYIAWGWLAFALFLYMILMASRPIRNRAYQFFLIQHLFLWFMIVASLVIHRPHDQGWIWAGFALHLLDRMARGLRIFYYHYIRRVDDTDDNPTGLVTVLSDDTIRVSVRTKQNWIPGQHVYLHCPEQSLGGHPFTVSNISRPVDQTDNARPKESTQELIIRVREGLTKRIYKLGATAKDDETIVEGKASGRKEPVPMKAWTEGPYGHEKYLGEDYDTLLLVAGGSGVSYALSNAMDIVRRARAMHRGSESRSLAISTKRLALVWMVKKPEQVAWIDDHLKEMCLLAPPHLLHITIFITGKRKLNEVEVMPGFVTHDKRDAPEASHSERDSTIERENSGRTKETVDHGAIVELRSGRPDFEEIVQREVDATEYAGWLAMGCCGPTPMNASLADAVSKAVQPKAVLRGEVRRNIYLTIEEFGW